MSFQTISVSVYALQFSKLHHFKKINIKILKYNKIETNKCLKEVKKYLCAYFSIYIYFYLFIFKE